MWKGQLLQWQMAKSVVFIRSANSLSVVLSVFVYVCVCVCVWGREGGEERERGREGERDIRPDVCKAACPWLIYLPDAPIIVHWTTTNLKYLSHGLYEWLYVADVQILVWCHICAPSFVFEFSQMALLGQVMWGFTEWIKFFDTYKSLAFIYIYIYIYIYMSRGKAIRPLDLVKNAVDTTVFSYMHRESMGMEKWPVFLQVRGFHKLANIRILHMFVKFAHLLERCFNPN